MSRLNLLSSYSLRVAAGLLLFSAAGATAFGLQVEMVPELDPGSIASGIAILAAAGMLIADRALKRARNSA